MPADALVVLDDGDQHLVQDVGSSLAEAVVCLAPASHQTNLASEVDVGGRQTDGDDVVLVEDRSVKMKKSYVEPIWLSQHISEEIKYCQHRRDHTMMIRRLLRSLVDPYKESRVLRNLRVKPLLQSNIALC